MHFSLEQLWQQLVYNPDAKILFTSGLFLFFFLAFLVPYWLLQGRDTLRIAWVTLFSLFFYYKCAGAFWIIHVVIVVVDFLLAQFIHHSQKKSERLAFLVLSLCLNLGILVYFKYSNYLAGLFNAAAGTHFGPWDLLLPVGVSFFTFQSLSYTLDVYRRELKPLDSVLDYAFFVTFFPQMVAGPIVRAADFLPQIRRPLWVSREQFGRGVFLFCVGMFKKAVIADYIGVNFVDRIFDEPSKYTGLENLFGVYGYALQIYCDFSGYSDMAIGIALLIGFQFPLNFNSPYQSLSITEFWRRWHISLSTWLRDYLYIPLGGNRGGSWGTWLVPGVFFAGGLAAALSQFWSNGTWWPLALLLVVAVLFVVPALLRSDRRGLSNSLNLLSTMLLGGLWHGAGNQFLLWGALHGSGLAVERWWKRLLPGTPGTLRRVLGGIWAFHFVCLCWIFFRAADLSVVQAVLTQIFTGFEGQILPDFVSGYAPVLFLMGVGYLLHFLPSQSEAWAQKVVTALPLLGQAVLLTLFILLVMQVKSSDVQPFIYFDF